MDELLYLNKTDMEYLNEGSVSIPGNALTLEMLTLKEQEDWIIVQEKGLKEENLDNGFVKCDFQEDG